MNSLNNINRIHNYKVSNIAECNSIHDILNPSKLTKNINIHYPPILHECMNNCRVKVKFQNFQIIWGSGCSYTSVRIRLIKTVT